jgi:diacylglycerol kinase family enzyme
LTRLLLINPRAGGGGATADEIAEAARARGVETRVLGEHDDVGELVRAAGAAVLGIAGGDGSLAPLGTRNHFAGDLGLDRRDPLAALDAFEGVERRVDVARLDGRLFLNNVSLGLYAGLVHRREHHRRRGEALAGARAISRVVRERHRMRVRVDGDELPARLLLVANNRYDLDLFTLGARPRLDEGKLSLYAADGWLPRRWTTRADTRFQIELEEPRVEAAADGEPVVLESPLEFEILPRALRVLVPPERDEARL